MSLTLRHVEPPFEGDCVRGFHDALRAGFAGADFNTRPSKDLVPLLAHGGLLSKGFLENPWTGKPTGTKVEKVTAAEWLTLGSPDGVRHPATVETLLAAIAAERLPPAKSFTPGLDLKWAHGSHEAEPYVHIKAAAVSHDVPCLVMTEQWSKSAAKTRAQKNAWFAQAMLQLAEAQQAGLPTMLLWREHIPADHPVWPLLTAVKGAPASQHLPAHVIRVPNSSTPAAARKVLARVTATVDWTAPTPSPTPTPTPEAPVTDKFRIPGALQKPLAINHAKDPFIIPAGAVFHVAVFEGPSLLPMYQARNDGIESTGYIRRDGTIEQYRPLDVECDAQLAGNSWISGGKRYGLTSWETQGGGPGEWTDAQIASIKHIISYQHETFGNPLRINPGPESSGFGYHRLFTAWNPHGHSCPGPDRVVQFHNTIVPWMSQGGSEDDMPLNDADKKWLGDRMDTAAETAVAKLLASKIGGLTRYGKPERRIDGLLGVLFNSVGDIENATKRLEAKP